MVITSIPEGAVTQYLDELTKLIADEWGQSDNNKQQSIASNRFDRDRIVPEPTVPEPIVALDGDTLMGGLTFTWWSANVAESEQLWINTVYIKPEYRRRGIASALIEAAMCKIRELDFLKSHKNKNTLFVHTDLPQLYLPLRWEIVSESQGMFVLKTAL